MSGARILVVDDDLHIRRLLRSALTRAGYETVEAINATEALAAAQTIQPAAILLDLGLPDRDGLEIVQLLRKSCAAPIIVISAREATDQKVAALDLGAHDYVTKPFDSEELLARLRATLRDGLQAQGATSVVEVGGIRIDLLNRTVTREGSELHLTRKEFAVLEQLARTPGRIVTHKQILQAGWPDAYDQRIEYLRIIVRNIRQKLEADPMRPALIINELGIGYRLSPD
ncbi:response regulator transcription factor [Sphingomonas naphthae]|uniref:Response regulator transcription factor n=1 Tax=Sphingomonas naphthae TaxID=1813468 RepID=A0ABY7TK83_9SPHN|nr:response regulator transcription factor [Sphingomonas naphthae]WCT73122.1 response regulator transcription factor [Sphingomonas naphthae]